MGASVDVFLPARMLAMTTGGATLRRWDVRVGRRWIDLPFLHHGPNGGLGILFRRCVEQPMPYRGIIRGWRVRHRR